MNEKNIISLEEVLLKFNKHNKEFIDNLNKEDELENSESINSIERNIINDIKGLKFQTEQKKIGYINELKNGLGDKVRQNPNKITKVKIKWYIKLINFIKEIFTKF